MLTVEMLTVDWNNHEHPVVVHRMHPTSTLGDANRVAKSFLESGRFPGCNGYRIKDESGDVVLTSWDR